MSPPQSVFPDFPEDHRPSTHPCKTDRHITPNVIFFLVLINIYYCITLVYLWSVPPKFLEDEAIFLEWTEKGSVDTVDCMPD